MLLIGQSALIALQRTKNPIALRDAEGARVATLNTWEDIIPYLERGYDLFGSKRRAQYFAPPEPRAAIKAVEMNPWVAKFITCWRNSGGAAVIAFHGDQISPGLLSRLAA